MNASKEVKAHISKVYKEKLESASCCGGDGACGSTYPLEVLDAMPDGTVSFGCGNPVALASLRRGEDVLDLGSGSGLDCLLAARAVGPEGSVIGVDFTQAMVDRARDNAAKLGLSNVSFRLGDIEALPVDDSSVDVVISNCVINLAQDKGAVFSEAYRVLRSGGRLMVSDLLLTRPATSSERGDMALLTGCVSGSLPTEDYVAKIREAGFERVEVDGEKAPEGSQFWFSAAISATKP